MPWKGFKQRSHFSLLKYWDTESKLWPPTWIPRSSRPARKRGPVEGRAWVPRRGGQRGGTLRTLASVLGRERSCLFERPTGHQIPGQGAGCRREQCLRQVHTNWGFCILLSWKDSFLPALKLLSARHNGCMAPQRMVQRGNKGLFYEAFVITKCVTKPKSIGL